MINWVKVPFDATDVMWKNDMRKVDREIEKNMLQTCQKMLAWTDSVEKRGFRDAIEEKAMRLQRLAALRRLADFDLVAIKAIEEREKKKMNLM